ncbi:hypothetical protein DFH09DRAFT_1106002 [Mycena vulgaris]|nr:hypothetical protein DFH09DRAFT_1106002 [Mycena vulgaris]
MRSSISSLRYYGLQLNATAKCVGRWARDPVVVHVYACVSVPHLDCGPPQLRRRYDSALTGCAPEPGWLRRAVFQRHAGHLQRDSPVRSWVPTPHCGAEIQKLSYRGADTEEAANNSSRVHSRACHVPSAQCSELVMRRCNGPVMIEADRKLGDDVETGEERLDSAAAPNGGRDKQPRMRTGTNRHQHAPVQRKTSADARWAGGVMLEHGTVEIDADAEYRGPGAQARERVGAIDGAVPPWTQNSKSEHALRRKRSVMTGRNTATRDVSSGTFCRGCCARKRSVRWVLGRRSLRVLARGWRAMNAHQPGKIKRGGTGHGGCRGRSCADIPGTRVVAEDSAAKKESVNGREKSNGMHPASVQRHSAASRRDENEVLNCNTRSPASKVGCRQGVVEAQR